MNKVFLVYRDNVVRAIRTSYKEAMEAAVDVVQVGKIKKCVSVFETNTGASSFGPGKCLHLWDVLELETKLSADDEEFPSVRRDQIQAVL